MSRLSYSQGWTEALAKAADVESVIQSLIQDIGFLEDNGKTYENFPQFMGLLDTYREQQSNEEPQEDEQD